MSVIVSIDHETGDLSQYTGNSTDSGDLSVAAEAALAGTNYGMKLVIDDTNNLYAYKDITSNTSGKARLRFYIDPNSITMANADELEVFASYRTASFTVGVRLMYVKFNYTTAGGYAIRAAIIDDGGVANLTSSYAITDAPHYVEVYLQRASSAVASDGSLQLWIDGVSKQTVTGIDNYDRFAGYVRTVLGAYTLDSGTSGTLYLDELVVNDDGSAIPLTIVGNATLIGSGTEIGIGLNNSFGTTLMLVLSDINGDGQLEIVSQSTLSGSSNLTAEIIRILLESGAFTGSGGLSSIPQLIVYASSGLSADGALDSDALQQLLAELSLHGTGNISSGSMSLIFDSGVLSGTGDILVIVDLVQQIIYGCIALFDLLLHDVIISDDGSIITTTVSVNSIYTVDISEGLCS